MTESDPYARTGEFHSDQSGSADVDAALAEHPEQIGRYRVERLLGQGGFGLVYLATDEQLQRSVAIKVPHRRLVSDAKAAKQYLMEAQTVAALDHANIVPVYDVNSSEECPLFVVSKFVEGMDLAMWLRESRLSHGEAARLVATIADALHYAHKQGIVHRDVKPGNTLIDRNGTPFLVDFGLALQDAEVGQASRFAGTPSYMSPEQARGEGHRVDGRSDIFSLGVMLYELLAGRKPFRSDSRVELLEQVKTFDPRPPRQLDDRIPRELERICLKAISKRASDRYTTAKDMADDLRAFLAELTIEDSARGGDSVSLHSAFVSTSTNGASASQSVRPTSGSVSAAMPSWEKEPLHIVPKGLRSFDEHDADFFLELLPGPCDRAGLPDSLRFWKTRIEETAPDKTFAVGLIYGPSGCGKSSFVKAGLLPRLANSVISVYIEATDDDTEKRLLRSLRRVCPNLPANLSLKDSLAGLRQGQFIAAGEKVVIVLDQFEQWLHAMREDENTELVEALRQCDGGRVQCIVMVRDDFWMAVTRMMREMEICLVEGNNSAAVDLFQIRHARKVLTAFGRANGDLVDGTKLSKAQQQFVEEAVSGLAEEGKVICVRLALFAEMMKGKPWTPASLKQVGGAAGVGVAFLDETFSASAARPEHRYHAQAARAVLKALLPDSGTDIKGHMRSREQLLDDSGYAQRATDFDNLLRILDTELRLITPTEAEWSSNDDNARSAQSFYQLTHDYLVPAVREWLTRKQKETRRGRAALRLEELSMLWNAKPERRRLPSWWEWARITVLTSKRQWTAPQRKMMRSATRSHTIAACVLVAVLAALGLGAFELNGRTRATTLIEKLQTAEIERVPGIVDDLSSYRRWADAGLQRLASDAPPDSPEQLHASLGLLPVDAAQLDALKQRLLTSDPLTLSVIRDELAKHGYDVKDWLWQQIDEQTEDEATRFRAALALAPLDPSSGEDDDRWSRHAAFLGSRLVDAAAARPSQYATLADSLRPVRAELYDSLHSIFLEDDPVRRKMATGLLVDYASDEPAVLADLIMDADAEQFATLLPLLDNFKNEAIARLSREVSKPLAAATSENEREQLGRRQANAGATLLRFNQPDAVWPLLKHSADPRARSYLIHRVAPLGVDPSTLLMRLAFQENVSIRRALLLALGEYNLIAFDESERDSIVAQVRSLYDNDPDAGIHAAAEWLLRSWGQSETLDEAHSYLANDAASPRQWRPTITGHTMVVIDGRSNSEIGRRFEISNKEVTVEQFRQFMPGRWMPEGNDRPEAAAGVVTWHVAIAYCQWLNEQDGIPEDQWCYPTFDPADEDQPRLEVDPTRTGYRLPTSAEWEFAARAGAKTSRYFGETAELLTRYAWFSHNSGSRMQLVGRLKPNGFGLFDMLGNVSEWNSDLVGTDLVGIGGGSYGSSAQSLVVTELGGALPRTKYNSYGFRVARTHPENAD